MTISQTLALAVEHQQAGRLVEAHALYKQVLASDPDEPDALRLMGQLTFKSGNPARAIELIERAIKCRPNVVDFHVDLARILFAQSDFPRSVVHYRKALDLDPFCSTDLHLNLARALAAVGENEDALKHVAVVLEKHVSADALALQGGLLLASGRVQQAVDRLQKAVEMEPQRADLVSTYALALQHRGDFDLAEQAYRRALYLSPEFAEVRNNLGYLLVLRRQLPAAVDELQQAVRIRPKYPHAHYHLALAFTGLGKTDEALASYKTALEQEPRMPDAWEALGRVLLDLRNYAAAVAAFTRAAAMRPASQVYLLLGVAHSGLEDLDSAIAATRKAVEIDPRSADATRCVRR